MFNSFSKAFTCHGGSHGVIFLLNRAGFKSVGEIKSGPPNAEILCQQKGTVQKAERLISSAFRVLLRS